MALLDDIKNVLGEYSNDNNAEINDLIAAAKSELKLAGVVEVKVNDATDPLIKIAITNYCKANFGYDDNSDRFQSIFESIKRALTLSEDYNS